MIDLVIHAVLHDQKNYHLFKFKILIKLFAKMKSRGAEYFEIMYAVDYIHTKS